MDVMDFFVVAFEEEESFSVPLFLDAEAAFAATTASKQRAHLECASVHLAPGATPGAPVPASDTGGGCVCSISLLSLGDPSSVASVASTAKAGASAATVGAC